MSTLMIVRSGYVAYGVRRVIRDRVTVAAYGEQTMGKRFDRIIVVDHPQDHALALGLSNQGREKALAEAKEWLADQRCRLVPDGQWIEC